MTDGEAHAGEARARADLDVAARIPRGENLRAGLADVPEFFREHTRGQLRLKKVVDARAAAAHVAAFERREPQARYRRKHAQRLGLRLLSVQKVARGIVCRLETVETRALAHARRGKLLTHVAH